jgi:Lipocalin-like domain
VIQGSIAYFGTYTVNEADKVITAQIEGSTFPNFVGTDQKRIITSITADELKFTNPAGSKVGHFNWFGNEPSRCGFGDNQRPT